MWQHYSFSTNKIIYQQSVEACRKNQASWNNQDAIRPKWSWHYSESHLVWSQFKIPFAIAYYIKTIDYCYHSFNVITFGPDQSDHIKWLPHFVWMKSKIRTHVLSQYALNKTDLKSICIGPLPNSMIFWTKVKFET